MKLVKSKRVKKIAIQVHLPAVDPNEFKTAQYRLSRKSSSRKKIEKSEDDTAPQLKAESHSLMGIEISK